MFQSFNKILKSYFNRVGDYLKRFIFHKKPVLKLCLLSLIALIIVYLIYPIKTPLFKESYSTVLKDRNGSLLGASISDDEQWRFPQLKTVPHKFKQCIIYFEDKNYYKHFGVDPGAVIRAVYLNLKHKRIVSGGSTLTMQTIRLSRKGKTRTYREKVIEALLAVKLELKYSKDHILALYASHAPFGGNVVGLDAAAWRYFGRYSDNLSWAEAALLAVLPNNPAMIRPGKNSPLLLDKRNSLLKRLEERGVLTQDEYELALEEPLPASAYPVPQIAPHLLTRAMKEGYKGRIIHSTIDINLQKRTTQIIARHHRILSGAMIHNACAIVVRVDNGEVFAYVGNTKEDHEQRHGNYVDIPTAQRSCGSLLKPFLYAFMLDEGLILPKQLLPDVPVVYDGFAPKNFGKGYDGAISANCALIRSLNVPFVHLLQEYGYQKFYRRLQQLGLTLHYPPSHYSLSLILGGVESSLYELTGIYCSLARVLKRSHLRSYQDRRYSELDYFPNNYVIQRDREDALKPDGNDFKENGLLGAASIWFTFDAMQDVVRPREEKKWRYFSSSKPIAWKTGTSFGCRDAWAIGITPEYVVGVWVGNADGEGRPEIRGAIAAAPILFDIFDNLPAKGWFQKPLYEMTTARICKKSGMLATHICEEVENVHIPQRGMYGMPCTYHKLVHLDQEQRHQVDSSNYPVSKMVHKSWFVLPPVQEWYYKRKNSTYKSLPPFKDQEEDIMQFIYPRRRAKILVPIELDGTLGKTVFEIAHRRPEALLFWHLDQEYIGETKNIHQMGFYPGIGEHELLVIDEKGNQLVQSFEIIPKTR